MLYTDDSPDRLEFYFKKNCRLPENNKHIELSMYEMCIHHNIFETTIIYDNNKYLSHNYTIHSDIQPSVILEIQHGT